jgi:type III secretion protein C
LLVCLAFALASFIGHATAAVIPFQREQVNYDLKDEPLKDFLERFFAEQNLQAVVSPLVANQGGTLNGPRAGTPEQVFRSIAASNQLTAYYDGGAVYIYKLSERITRYFAVPPLKTQDFVRAFQEMRLGDSNNSFSARADTGLVVVSGTPRFIDQAQELTATLRQENNAAPASFRLFSLQYAMAADTNMTVGNHVINVPGVATILRQLMYPNQGSASFAAPRDQILRPTATRLKGSGLAAVGNEGDRAGLPPPLAPPSTQSYSEPPNPNGTPIANAVEIGQPGKGRDARIVADPYRNAVIVRDAPDTMPLYASLIKQLDIEPRIVEIEATIIDVDKQKLLNLGVDWRWQNGRTAVQFGTDSGATAFQNQLTQALGLNSITNLPEKLPGLQIGAIVGDSGKFIARINALGQRGITNVVSHPQVLTLNDVEAVIENTQTLYVPVGGAYEVDLFNVIAGTVLRVTPHIITEFNRDRIRLVMNIEDGDVTFQSVSNGGFVPQNTNYPTVTRTAVNTQTIINAGDSLLLGGLVKDSSSVQVDKIPLLGDIPVLGNAFKHTVKDRSRRERLFLISPRLVALNQIAGQTPGVTQPGVNVDSLDAQDEREQHHRAEPPLPAAPKEQQGPGAAPAAVEKH